MDKLNRLRNSSHSQTKRLVLRALRDRDSGGCHQSSLVKYICSLTEVTSLRGNARKDFEAKVNKAVGALLREKRPKIERSKSSDYLRLVRHMRKTWTY
jgi:hypothetical protein